jgi:4-amino-4-deoxy-L-arabinose transferase-like glycosyltransferase
LKTQSKSLVNLWILAAIVLVAFFMLTWGIKKNLPYVPEADEGDYFVGRSVAMAAQGNLTPGWFGHPGSTTFYPLAALYRLLYGAQAQALFGSSPAGFFILGRFLSIAYSTLSLPLIFQIGRKAFGARAGFIAAWLYLFYSLAAYYAQVVRTDSSATFFGLLSLWRILKLYERPSLKNQVWAGVFIGLSIASRYFMLTLVPILLAVDGLRLLKPPRYSRQLWLSITVGLFSILAAFALSTPGFFLKFNTVLADLAVENEPVALGADGLTRPGNLAWYLTQAIPQAITWLQYLWVIVGLVFIVVRKRMAQLLLVGYAAVFLAAISLSHLHWDRWVIPILPILALVASFGLTALSEQPFFKTASRQIGFLALGAVILAAWPAYDLVLHDIRDSSPSTRVLARNWVIDHLPPGSHVIQEWYAAPLAGAGFAVTEKPFLADTTDFQQYYLGGYRYLIVSNWMYGRFFSEPARYAAQIGFYNKLFACNCLLQEFNPTLTLGGPTIRIYQLSPPKS